MKVAAVFSAVFQRPEIPAKRLFRLLSQYNRRCRSSRCRGRMQRAKQPSNSVQPLANLGNTANMAVFGDDGFCSCQVVRLHTHVEYRKKLEVLIIKVFREWLLFIGAPVALNGWSQFFCAHLTAQINCVHGSQVINRKDIRNL